MKKMQILTWIATGSLFLAAGSLVFPATIGAGDLDSSRPGEPSSKSLEAPPPTSSLEKSALDRFESVLDGTAVRDRQTGVVWELSPEPAFMNWQDAVNHCENLELAGRKRWRLPTIDELKSLVDSSGLGSPKLPSGHPFDTGCRLGGCVQSATYWSATPATDNGAHIWLVCFCNGAVSRSDKKYDNHVWCARGENGDGTD